MNHAERLLKDMTARAKLTSSPTVGPKRLKVRGLSELVASARSKRNYLVPYLLPEAGNLLVSVEDGVESRMAKFILTYCVTGKKLFDPFGPGPGVLALFCSAAGDKHFDAERLDLLSKCDPGETSRERALENFHLYHRDFEGDDPIDLNTTAGQDIFNRAIPPQCKVIVFDEVLEWAWPKPAPNGLGEFGQYVKNLNERGISVVAFVDGSKAHAQAIFKEMSQSVQDVRIRFAKDPGAPKEFGAGFRVHRARLSEADPVPTTFLFRYAVVDGVLKFGWACPEPDAANSKELEMTEREMKVEKLLAEGKQQRVIAELLNVDPATVSRDKDRIVSKRRRLTTDEGQAAKAID